MRIRMHILIWCCLLVAASGASSCRVFDPSGLGDFGQDKDGNAIMLDTRRNWSMWTFIINDEVANEVRNERPPAEAPSWEAYWLSLIEEQQEGRENKKRYINYILDSRRQAGLDPLPIETTNFD